MILEINTTDNYFKFPIAVQCKFHAISLILNENPHSNWL